MATEFKTTYTLEMCSPGDLRPARVSLPGLRVERMQVLLPEFNAFLHTVVGSDYRWGGHSDWGKDEWTAYVRREELETWVASHPNDGGAKRRLETLRTRIARDTIADTTQN